MIKAAEPVGGHAGAMVIPAAGGPTVLRILLGAQLRRLREAKRITLEDAGKVIRASHSKISRLETGRVGFKDRDIADLLTFYGVTDEQERDGLRALARRANAPGLVARLLRRAARWFEAYVGLEEAPPRSGPTRSSSSPACCRPRTTRARSRCSATTPPRRRRSSGGSGCGWPARPCSTGPQPPHSGRCSTRRCCAARSGGPASCAASSSTCSRLPQRPNVTIQVIPFQAGGHAAAGGPFSILRFAEPDLPDVVYLEQLTSALYLDKPETVDSYLTVMERLCMEAATPAASAEIIATLLEA